MLGCPDASGLGSGRSLRQRHGSRGAHTASVAVTTYNYVVAAGHPDDVIG